VYGACQQDSGYVVFNAGLQLTMVVCLIYLCRRLNPFSILAIFSG